jgi:hypothetical protein
MQRPTRTRLAAEARLQQINAEIAQILRVFPGLRASMVNRIRRRVAAPISKRPGARRGWHRIVATRTTGRLA